MNTANTVITTPTIITENTAIEFKKIGIINNGTGLTYDIRYNNYDLVLQFPELVSTGLRLRDPKEGTVVVKQQHYVTFELNRDVHGKFIENYDNLYYALILLFCKKFLNCNVDQVNQYYSSQTVLRDPFGIVNKAGYDRFRIYLNVNDYTTFVDKDGKKFENISMLYNRGFKAIPIVKITRFSYYENQGTMNYYINYFLTKVKITEIAQCDVSTFDDETYNVLLQRLTKTTIEVTDDELDKQVKNSKPTKVVNQPTPSPPSQPLTVELPQSQLPKPARPKGPPK